MGLYRIKEIRDWSDGELNKRLTELRGELIRLRRGSVAGGPTDNPARVRLIRKTIARILTVKRERELQKISK